MTGAVAAVVLPLFGDEKEYVFSFYWRIPGTRWERVSRRIGEIEAQMFIKDDRRGLDGAFWLQLEEGYFSSGDSHVEIAYTNLLPTAYPL